MLFKILSCIRTIKLIYWNEWCKQYELISHCMGMLLTLALGKFSPTLRWISTALVVFVPLAVHLLCNDIITNTHYRHFYRFQSLTKFESTYKLGVRGSGPTPYSLCIIELKWLPTPAAPPPPPSKTSSGAFNPQSSQLSGSYETPHAMILAHFRSHYHSYVVSLNIIWDCT